MRRYLAFGLMFSLLIASLNGTRAQELDKETVKKMIDAPDFKFKADMALPMNGQSRFLTSPYDLKVSPDTLSAYLPYFGRAYQAPRDLSGGGIKFESIDFDYELEERKKGGWDLVITPHDAEDVEKLRLTVSENGSAWLQVTSHRRQPISFKGWIDDRKEE